MAKTEQNKNIFEDTVSIVIKIKDDRVADPENVRFKFSWSTSLIPCDGKVSKNCPMKDPRTNWDENIVQQVWVGAGIFEICL